MSSIFFINFFNNLRRNKTQIFYFALLQTLFLFVNLQWIVLYWLGKLTSKNNKYNEYNYNPTSIKLQCIFDGYLLQCTQILHFRHSLNKCKIKRYRLFLSDVFVCLYYGFCSFGQWNPVFILHTITNIERCMLQLLFGGLRGRVG